MNIEAIVKELNEVLNLGYASVVENYKGIPCRIKITKSGQIEEKIAIVEELNKKISNIKIVDQIFNFLEEKGFEEDFLKNKRIYRQNRGDLKNPEHGPRHASNRITKNLGTRISADHIEAFNRVSSHYKTKREALERAIELLEESHSLGNE